MIFPFIDLNDSLTRLSNVELSRLKILERYSTDAVTATNWLRQNKHQFQNDVYEPLMLHVMFLSNCLE